jgi:hypothetical protein
MKRTIRMPRTSKNKEAPMLIITSDFGSILACKTYDELMHVADTMISAKSDIQVLDAAYPDLCTYKTSVGQFCSGQNMDALLEAGHDPLRVMVEKLQDAGIAVLAGIRMNDHHGEISSWTSWEQEHTEWSLGKDTEDRGWRAVGDLRQMDYAIEGVREHRLAIIKEIVTNYPVDGIQLDFGRTAPFLSDPKRENAKFMTQYVRDVRHILDNAANGNRGELMLGAILPWDLDFCLGEGLEADRWIEEHLVSHVSPGEWFYSDWNIPLTNWRQMTEGTGCKLVPLMLGNVSPIDDWENGKKTLLGDNKNLDGPKIRAIAESYYGHGSDGVMFYNFYVGAFGDYYPSLRAWTDPDRIPQMSRQYFFCRRLKYAATEHDTFSVGDAFDRFPLSEVGDVAEFAFYSAADLSGSTAAFRFKLKNMTEGDELAVTLNGSALVPLRIVNEERQSDEGSSYCVAVWESSVSTPPMRLGENQIRVVLQNSGSGRLEPIEVGEFELQIHPGDPKPNL